MPGPSPLNDEHLAKRYGAGTLDQKVQNKLALQQQIGWPKEPRRPAICLPAGMSEALGGELLKTVLPGLLTLKAELFVLGKGSSTYGSLFTTLAKQHSHRVHIVSADDASIHQMYAAADMALFLSTPSAKELAYCLAYGVVPVSLPASSLHDYDPVQEAGNAFVYEETTPWHCFAALVRACETYKFPFDWRTIQKHCMESAR